MRLSRIFFSKITWPYYSNSIGWSPYKRNDDFLDTEYHKKSHQQYGLRGSNNRSPVFNKVSGFNGRSRGFGSNYGAGAKLNSIDWTHCNLNELRKNNYKEQESVIKRDQSEIDEWMKQNEVTLYGKNIPRPIFSFKESTFPDPIQEILLKNYTQPTNIQSVTWPVALSGLDLVSIAKTGSGKTLGFILPGIIHAINQTKRDRRDGPTVLVLLPTRELAQQVDEVAKKFCRTMNLYTTCIFGGASKNIQADALMNGVDLCVATPGRLLDFLEMDVTNLKRCSFLVLDEADRMLDMGFEPQMRKIVSQIRPDRQTLMFSATWPTEVRHLANDFLDNPVHLNIGSSELAANHNIVQNVDVIDESRKANRLIELLGEIKKQPESKTLIFVATKYRADTLARNLVRRNLIALTIHGDKSQSQRDYVLGEFRKKEGSILIATDVAARGLDISDIKFVINFDYPNSSRDYIHRIGRTGRGENKGTSHTFVTPEQGNYVRDLINVLKEAKQVIPESLLKMSFGGRF